MCSPAYEAKIKDKIEEFVDQNKMFSAYDVTLTLRNEGMRVSHRDVRRICHTCLDNEEIFDDCWTRTMHNIPGTTAQAYIFHHEISHDLADYEPVQKDYKDDPGHVHPPISSASLTTIRQPGSRNKQPVNGSLSDAKPASDGRLYVPAVLARQAKLKGRLVTFYHNYQGNEELIVTRKRRWDEDWSEDADATDEVGLRSDNYHNIRIPTKLIQKIGKSNFEIVVDGEDIKIR